MIYKKYIYIHTYMYKKTIVIIKHEKRINKTILLNIKYYKAIRK